MYKYAICKFTYLKLDTESILQDIVARSYRYYVEVRKAIQFYVHVILNTQAVNLIFDYNQNCRFISRILNR